MLTRVLGTVIGVYCCGCVLRQVTANIKATSGSRLRIGLLRTGLLRLCRPLSWLTARIRRAVALLRVRLSGVRLIGLRRISWLRCALWSDRCCGVRFKIRRVGIAAGRQTVVR